MKALDQETEIPEAGQEDAAISQQEEMSDMDLLRSMLEKEKSTLEEMLKVNKVEPHPALEKILRKKKLLVGGIGRNALWPGTARTSRDGGHTGAAGASGNEKQRPEKGMAEHLP